MTGISPETPAAPSPGRAALLTEVVPVRFPKTLADAAQVLAESEEMTVSAWIRREVGREISRREGQCSQCGQRLHSDGLDAAAATRDGEP